MKSNCLKIYISILLCVLCLACNDPGQSAEGWLPSGKNQSSTHPEINRLLRAMDGKFRVLQCVYEEAVLKETILLDNSGFSGWEYDLEVLQPENDPDALDLNFTFRVKEKGLSSAGLAIAFDLYDWSEDNYVMIPASVYNGNRNRIVDRDYAQGLDRSDLYREDLSLTTCAVPQLSPEAGALSRIEVNTSNTTTPAICVFDQRKKQGLIVLAEQGIRIKDEIIDHAFIVEENRDRTQATLVVSAPGVREYKPEFIGFSQSPDRGRDWKAGDELSLRLRVYRFNSPDMPAFFDRFMSVRKSLTGSNSPRNLIPLSETNRIMPRNIDNRFYDKEGTAFYCPENADWISFGWIGGLMNTFPMLALGDPSHRERVKKTFDFAIPRAQGAAGYFYGALNHDGNVFGREGYDEFPEIVLTRKNADVLYWMIKQFILLDAQGHKAEINPVWEQNIQRLADAFTDTWKRFGQWGNFVNNRTGEIAVYNTSGGVMAIGGLVLAADWYDNPEYLEVAKEAARYYYEEDFLKSGMTTGGCADILQNADSETAVAFLTSLMTLYEYTGEKEWLQKSRDLAHLCASWTVSFDYELPANTPLAKLDARLAGAVWASTQNKHGAPGFCTSAGEALFKLYRETGDEQYAELMRDIIHAHAEGIQPNGLITERLTYCDADSRGSRGDGGKTGWNETNGAMMAIEVPGIYLRTDMDRMFVFDHVEAIVLHREDDVIILEITNPTCYDASVSILAESEEQINNPLKEVSFVQWPGIKVKAGERSIIRVPQ